MSKYVIRFFLTLHNCCVIFIVAGGDYIEVIILSVVSIILSYILVTINFILNKSKYIISYNFINKKINKYIFSINYTLYKLDYPFKLTLKRYLCIKFIISIYLFLIFFLLFKNILLSLVIFIIIFYIPNILIYIFKKYDNYKINKDISNIVQSLIFLRNSNIDIDYALNIISKNIKYKRLRFYFSNFFKDKKILNDKFTNFYLKNLISILSNKTQHLQKELEVLLMNITSN